MPLIHAEVTPEETRIAMAIKAIKAIQNNVHSLILPITLHVPALA
jgi:hypothetical protein